MPTHVLVVRDRTGQIRRASACIILVDCRPLPPCNIYFELHFARNKVRMQNSNSAASFQSLEDESPEIRAVDKSLQELRELGNQLHYAADHCETTFLNAQRKNIVLENTKEYICRAVVTVVDHLGTVSAKLSSRISQTNAFSEADLRINCLMQRLLACEQYGHKLALTRLRWSESLTRYHRRYLSMPIANVGKAYEDSRDTDDHTNGKIIEQHELDREEDVPLFLYTYTDKQSLEKGNSDLALALPVRDGLSVLSKGLNPTFQFQGAKKIRSSKKSMQGSDILSLVRRTKRTT